MQTRSGEFREEHDLPPPGLGSCKPCEPAQCDNGAVIESEAFSFD